jgi:protein-L-isoaspartate O-methyltransferase
MAAGIKLPRALVKPLKILGGLIALLASGALVDQLWCLRHLSGEQFLDRAARIQEVSSFQSTSYIGTSGGRVYLEFWQAGRPKRIVYWAELKELPEDLADRLRDGENLWNGRWEK